MVRNALAVPYSWLLRPRFVVYGWLIVEWAWWPGSLQYVMAGCVAVLSLKTLTGFFRIRRSL